MKLCRYGSPGSEKTGEYDSRSELRDLSALIDDLTPETLPFIISSLSDEADTRRFPRVLANPRLGAPLRTVSKFIGIGMNYLDHAREAALPVPDDAIILPPHALKADWEAELGVVIGRQAK